MKVLRYIKDNYYNLPAIQDNIPMQDSVLGGVIATRQSKYSFPNMESPLLSNRPRVMQSQPPSTYDNQAITSMDNFTPYTK